MKPRTINIILTVIICVLSIVCVSILLIANKVKAPLDLANSDESSKQTVKPQKTFIQPVQDETSVSNLGNTFQQLLEEAEQGDAEAQFNLGYMYRHGEGVPQDSVEAAKWNRKSAEQGNAGAQADLGNLYFRGAGVPKDWNLAFEWFKKAAEQGLPFAQFKLGFLYAEGYGVQRDYNEAFKWHKKAAEQGYALAQRNLGDMYEDGKGVPRDYKQAVIFYHMAAELGNTNAQANLAEMYAGSRGVVSNYVEAYKWCLLAEGTRKDIKKIRSSLKREMTAEQIAEAQELAKALAVEIERLGWNLKGQYYKRRSKIVPPGGRLKSVPL